MEEDYLFTSIRYDSEEKDSLNLLGLRSLLSKTGMQLSSGDLETDSYVIRKLIYKMTGPFRGHKHFQWLKRVNRYLKRLNRSEGFAKTASEQIVFNADGSGRCFSGERWMKLVEEMRHWLSRSSMVFKSAVECFRLTFQQLDRVIFVPTNLLVVGVMSRIAGLTATKLLAAVDNFGLLLTGWHGKLKFVGKAVAAEDSAFDVSSIFGAQPDQSSLMTQVEMARRLITAPRDLTAVSDHVNILRSLLKCQEYQLKADLTAPIKTAQPGATDNLFNWSVSLANDVGETVARQGETQKLKRKKETKRKKVNTNSSAIAVVPQANSMVDKIKKTKTMKDLKLLRAQMIEGKSVKGKKRKQLQSLATKIDALLGKKKQITKAALKKEFQQLKKQLTSTVVKGSH